MSNSIWHKQDEKPKDFCEVVLSDFRTGSYCVFLSPFHDLSFNYDRWCYFDELLAQADKAERLEEENEAMRDEFEVWHGNYECVVEDKERLQKAVDYALHVLDNVSEIGGIDLEMIKIEQLIKETTNDK